MVRFLLDRGERVLARRGCMVGMSGEAEVSTRLWGNPASGLQRRLTRTGGFLLNRFSGLEHGAEVLLAGGVPGDIEPVELRSCGLMVRRGAFLACGDGVRGRGGWTSAALMVTGEGSFFLRCGGEGVVVLGGFGALRVLDLEEGEGCLVERGCVVAYDRSVRMRVGRLGTLRNALMMRRLLVARVRGPGRVLVQNRNAAYFRRWVRRGVPALPQKEA